MNAVDHEINECLANMCEKWNHHPYMAFYAYKPYCEFTQHAHLRLNIATGEKDGEALDVILHRNLHDDLSSYLLYAEHASDTETTHALHTKILPSILSFLDEIERIRKAPFTLLFALDVGNHTSLVPYIRTHPLYHSVTSMPEWTDFVLRDKRMFVNIRDVSATESLLTEQRAIDCHLQSYKEKEPLSDLRISPSTWMSESGHLDIYTHGFLRRLHRRLKGEHVCYVDPKHEEGMDFSEDAPVDRIIDCYLTSLKKLGAVRNVLNPPRYHFDKVMGQTVFEHLADTIYQLLRQRHSPEDIEGRFRTVSSYPCQHIDELAISCYAIAGVYLLSEESGRVWHVEEGISDFYRRFDGRPKEWKDAVMKALESLPTPV